MIDPIEARKNLETMEAEAWVRLYAAGLLDRLANSELRRESSSRSFTVVSAAVKDAHEALKAIGRALERFRRETGWTPGKNVPTTQKRWKAARRFAVAVGGALVSREQKRAGDAALRKLNVIEEAVVAAGIDEEAEFRKIMARLKGTVGRVEARVEADRAAADDDTEEPN